MSAPNFASGNASKYFCFGFNRYFTQEDIEANEWENVEVGEFDEIGTQMNFDSAMCNVLCELKNKGWEEIEEWDNNRSYQSKFFAEKTIEFDYCNAHITIRARACATSAYYEGATFDWDGQLIVEAERYWDYNNGGEYDLPDTEGSLAQWVVEDDWFNNLGLDKIHAKNVVARIEREFEKLTDEAENVFQQYCEETLVRVGIFSNGEAIYRRATA